MRRAAAAVLLAGPAVLAFFTGGYLDDARAWAGLVAWVLVVAGVLAGDLPRSRPAALALGGAAAFALWTAVSVAWAPLSGSGWDAAQLAVLYLGVLAAGALLLRDAPVEPALLGGIVVVVGYGLSERLLPGLLDFTQSVSAQGRLEQPLTYWNGMGLLAATGLVLSARLTALGHRAAAACAPLLGLGLGLTVSRGAILAGVAGLVALVVLTRRREQLVAAVGVVVAAVLASAIAAPFDGVVSLTGDERELQGAVVLAALVLLSALAAAAPRPPAGPLRLPRNAGLLAVAAVGLGLGVVLLLGSEERTLRPDASRLVTLKSNRYEYWRVAARAFADRPVHGVGAGGWAVRWRKERPFRESANDAHSLYLQTAAELGLVGLVLLGIWFGGVALAARAGPPGLAAVVAVWAVHVTLDWDFELPAATLPAMVAAGALLGGHGSVRHVQRHR